MYVLLEQSAYALSEDGAYLLLEDVDPAAVADFASLYYATPATQLHWRPIIVSAQTELLGYRSPARPLHWRAD